MRWIVFVIVLFVTLALQTAVAPFLAVQTVRPDFAALLAIHIALAAPALEAPLAACLVGLAVDLLSSSYGARANVGAGALAYGLVALVIVRVRKHTFRDHALTYFVFALLGTTMIHALRMAHMLYVTDSLSRWPGGVVAVIGWGVYAAAISPYAHWLLRRSRLIWGAGPSRAR